MSITFKDIELKKYNSTIDPQYSSGYCPISVKDEMNPPSINYMSEMTNRDLFLSEKNVHYMTYYMIAANQRNDTGVNPVKLAPLIPKLMKEWADKECLNSFEYCYDDPVQLLIFINKKFITNNSKIYKPNGLNTINVYRMKGTTTDKCGNDYRKPYNEMTAEDIRNIDVWKDEEIMRYDKEFRYGNKFPVWQYSASVRPYERGPGIDGLASAYACRSSLNNQLGKYDMSNYIKGSEYWMEKKNYYYENI